MKNIIAFSASNSANSINLRLLNFANQHLSGLNVITVDIRDYPMAMYSIDTETQQGFPESAVALKKLFANADGFVIATPEHNGSMPAVFKNAIDWLSRMVDKEQSIFNNTPVMLLSTSPGPNGGATNIQNLIQLMPWWGAQVKGSYSLGSFYENVIEDQLIEQEALRLTEMMNTFKGAFYSI